MYVSSSVWGTDSGFPGGREHVIARFFKTQERLDRCKAAAKAAEVNFESQRSDETAKIYGIRMSELKAASEESDNAITEMRLWTGPETRAFEASCQEMERQAARRKAEGDSEEKSFQSQLKQTLKASRQEAKRRVARGETEADAPRRFADPSPSHFRESDAGDSEEESFQAALEASRQEAERQVARRETDAPRRFADPSPSYFREPDARNLEDLLQSQLEQVREAFADGNILRNESFIAQTMYDRARPGQVCERLVRDAFDRISGQLEGGSDAERNRAIMGECQDMITLFESGLSEEELIYVTEMMEGLDGGLPGVAAVRFAHNVIEMAIKGVIGAN
ncbi:MAG: hypothetical protein LBJ71_02325 [Holosporaceae bacterium]|nr:hypothetical protein [Holosporaceae bacterium]